MLLLIATTSVRADDRTNTIGVIIPLTGNLANYGQTVRRAIERVQIPGIRWVFEDEACDATKTVSAFKKLTELEKTPFILGPCCGSPQKAVAPLLKQRDLLVLLPNAASERVFSDSEGKMYSIQYSVEREAQFLAEQMDQRGLKEVAILSVDSDFSRVMEESFLKEFKGKAVYTSHFPGFDVQHAKSAALQLKKRKFDSLFFADISPFFLGMLTELSKLGIGAVPVFSNYGTQMPDISVAEGSNANGIYYSYPDVPDNEDALGYFPNLAAQLLANTVKQCQGEFECVAKFFAQHKKVRKDGTFEGRIILKRIDRGQYVRVTKRGGV